MAIVVGGVTGAAIGGTAGAISKGEIVSKPTAIGIAVGGFVGLLGTAAIVCTGGMAAPAVVAGAGTLSTAVTLAVTTTATVTLTAVEGAEIDSSTDQFMMGNFYTLDSIDI